MLDSILTTSTTGSLSLREMALCTAASLALGIIAALVYLYKAPRYSKSFVITLALLPTIVQAVITLVNGNLGTGVAVAGAFSLVRFRSVPGSAREIGSIFFAMAIGLATGMGYIGYAALFTLILGIMMILLAFLPFGGDTEGQKTLKITIPEDLDYDTLFTDLFESYTSKHSLERVKTSNLGSLYELQYTVRLKDDTQEKEFLDKIRCRNGNLNLSCGRAAMGRDEL